MSHSVKPKGSSLSKRTLLLGAGGLVAGAAFIGWGTFAGSVAQAQATAPQSTATPVTPATPLTPVWTPLRGERLDRSTFANPNANIPAQCYAETSFGTQNACQFCHTNGVARLKLGNNNPQAGADPTLGNLQAQYQFTTTPPTRSPNASQNLWRNTIAPQELSSLVARLGYKAAQWDMQSYMRQGNWQAAYDKRVALGGNQGWDSGVSSPFRLFPMLSPADLPAQSDGFVRTREPKRAMLSDARGLLTGWRAINFMPYGIFTPLSGSVSGVYIRLSAKFMQRQDGQLDADIYRQNLDIVRDNVQGRLNIQGKLGPGAKYVGAAASVPLERGQYPVGTEFAHPLHYVDLAADGHDPRVSPFPGTRSRRIKEIRWMYKVSPWEPEAYGKPAPIREITDDSEGDESGEAEAAGVLASRTEGWINNGAGWLLGGWIEDGGGDLRAQTPSELTQCAACHSGNASRGSVFTSGTGNTVDSTWAMPRQLSAAQGWQEMNYLGYIAPKNKQLYGQLTTPEPVNREQKMGEYRYFLSHVVGVSLYGNMPVSVDDFLHAQLSQRSGYSANWPSLTDALHAGDAQQVRTIQETRQKLMREYTAKGAYLNGDHTIRPELFLPLQADALAQARLYRQVVVTQRYDYGKDVFTQAPFSFRYFRTPEVAFTHQNGAPYRVGELITDRPYQTDPTSPDYGVGTVSTLIKETGNLVSDYTPFLK